MEGYAAEDDEGERPQGHLGTFFTELLEASPEEPFAAEQEPIDPEVRKAEAVTSIAAHFRGHSGRRRVAGLRVQHLAARKLQSYWATTLTRMATRLEIQRRHDEDRELHLRLMEALAQDWFQTKQLRRVEVHLCSLTMPEHRRDGVGSYQAMQCAQIARLFRLVDSKRDAIFVAPKQLHEDILDYYAKIMQFRGVRNPAARFQVVVPEQMGLLPHLSLTQGLLCSPKALRRIRRLTSGRQAYIVPDVVTHAELRVAGRLQLPIFGPGPKNMALLASKSNGKKLAQLAEVPVGPWAVDIYDEDEFFTSLAGLLIKHPQVRMWVLKIDDERDARGIAYLDLSKLREVGEALRSAQDALAGPAGGYDSYGYVARSRADDEPTLVGAHAEEVRMLLRKYVPKRVSLCNRRAYPDFAAWMGEVSRVGAIIQAVPDDIVSHTSVHLQLEPDGGVSVLGSSEAVQGAPFVRTASFYPHTRGSWEVLHEVGMRMGRVLASKGAVGFTSVDVVFFENPYFDAMHQAEVDREDTPVVIGSETPVDPRHLMFSDLRSPSPTISTVSEAVHAAPVPLSESRQADYDLALQLQELSSSGRVPGSARSPVNLMLGAPPQVGASPASRFACWVVDVDVRLTDEACALFPIQFVAQLRLRPETGMLRLVPGAVAAEEADRAAQSQQQQHSQPEGGDAEEAHQRFALVSAAATSEALERMSHQTLFQTAKMRGVSFDLFHNVGCVFTFLDLVHTLFSLMVVDRSAEGCAKRLAAAMGALAEGPTKMGQSSTLVPKTTQVTRPKVSAPKATPGLAGREVGSGHLTATDIQSALRTLQKRWSDKQRRS